MPIYDENALLVMLLLLNFWEIKHWENKVTFKIMALLPDIHVFYDT